MKASEEADAAFQAYQKADQDMANSRLQIEKVNWGLGQVTGALHSMAGFSSSFWLVG